MRKCAHTYIFLSPPTAIAIASLYYTRFYLNGLWLHNIARAMLYTARDAGLFLPMMVLARARSRVVIHLTRHSAARDFPADGKMILASFIHHSAAFSVVLPVRQPQKMPFANENISREIKTFLVNGEERLRAAANSLSMSYQIPINLFYWYPVVILMVTSANAERAMQLSCVPF